MELRKGWMNMDMKKAFTSKRFKYGTVSTLISVIFLAAVIIVNVLASVLVDKFPMNIDLTQNHAFELSEASANFVKEIEKPITITVLANEKQLESGGDIYSSQVKNVIDQYAKYNKNITIKYVDIVSDPTFAASYPDLTLNYNDIVVDCGGKTRKISMYDMFNINYNQYTGQQTIQSSKAEQMMTSAIMGVTSDALVRVSILTGHDETELPALQELLEQNNFEVVTQNLSTEDVDPTADVAFLLAPGRDPDAEMLDKLDKWLENNQEYGKSLIYAADAQKPVETPNLDAFLADWGIGAGMGAVLETDQNKVFNYNPFFCTVEYVADEYQDDITGGVKVSMPFGRPLEALYETQSGRKVTTLLQYSESACVRPVDAAEDWQPAQGDLGAVPALLRSTYTRYEGNEPLSSNVFAFSAVSAFESVVLNSKSVANAEYAMNMLNTLTERSDVITVAPKELGGSELGINQLQANIISAVLVYVIPILIIVAGLVIWLRRRHK